MFVVTVARTRWMLAVFGLMLGIGVGNAHAESAGRAAVIVVEGGKGDAVASQIAKHIETPHAVRDAQTFVTALGVRGTRMLSSAIDNHTLDTQLVTRARAAAADVHVDIVILVAHKKVRRGVRGHLWVIDAHGNGAPIDQDLASTTVGDEATEVWTAAASFFPPPAKETAPITTAKAPIHRDVAVEANAQPPADHGVETPAEGAPQELARSNALVVLEADVIAGSRHMTYVDRLSPGLRPYDLFAAPLASIAAEVYPLARTPLHRVVRGIGVTGDYARAFGLGSADTAGTHVGTRWQSFDFGLRERIPIEQTIMLGVDVGYGAIDFSFDKPTFAAVLPSAAYRFVRLGLDARGARGGLSVFGGGAYLAVLSAGEMGALFPRESVGGIEGRIGAAYAVARAFELSLAFTYTRFFYSMHPEPGDANVAGGALDQMMRLSLGLAYLL